MTTSTRCPCAGWARSPTWPQLVRFLLGPESSWITGTSVSVDGGHHLRRGPDFEPIALAMWGDAAKGIIPEE